jgi:dephospho-CoA kinase
VRGTADTARTGLVVGVAGKCCAGKDLVTQWLLQQGWREINVDAVGHEALAARHREIVAAFGPHVLGDGATIDRGKLGRRVFGNPEELRRLEEIVHPWMRDRVAAIVAEFRHAPGPSGLVINAALLFHMQLDSLCDVILLVRAPLIERLRRARRRDDLPVRHMLQRLWSQRHLDTQAYGSSADTITVDNGKSPADLYRQLEGIQAFHNG